MNFIRSIIAALFGRAAEQNRKQDQRRDEKAKSRAVADDVTPLIATAAIFGATASTPGGKNVEMNEGDVHSGPEGYSPNTGYTDTFYGSGDFAGGDFGGGDGGGAF